MCQVSNILSKPNFYKAKLATASVLGLSHGFRDHCRENRQTHMFHILGGEGLGWGRTLGLAGG